MKRSQASISFKFAMPFISSMKTDMHT